MLQPGASAPDIDLPDTDGASWSLREALRNGPVVLAFFKISCPTCQFTFPFLQRLADSADGGAQLIAISQDDAEDTREFQQSFGVSMATLLDASPDYPASNAYGIAGVPSIFWSKRTGKSPSPWKVSKRPNWRELGAAIPAPPLSGKRDRVPDLRPG